MNLPPSYLELYASQLPLHAPEKILRVAAYHLYTVILFTWTDYKTIHLPITIFACSTAPVNSFRSFIHAEFWIWSHLLLCNVANQSRSGDEDAINRPWRPLPSNRLTRSQAITLRWALVVFCVASSAAHSTSIALITIFLVIITYLHDECGLSAHPFGKNVCNVGGYTSFELAATKLMSKGGNLDKTTIKAVILSGSLILTTIHAQDFPDVAGDIAMGRITFPIYAPEISRIFTIFALILWSIALTEVWGIGECFSVLFLVLGVYVGWRYYWWRSQEADRRSYIIFNAWLMLAHVLPLHARMGFLGY